MRINATAKSTGEEQTVKNIDSLGLVIPYVLEVVSDPAYLSASSVSVMPIAIRLENAFVSSSLQVMIAKHN